MTLTQTIRSERQLFWGSMKSFFVWIFVLTVCWFVLGFPLIVLLVTGGTLLAIALQAVLSGSAVFFVAVSLFTVNISAILVAAAILTLRGIYPHQIKWLSWLNQSNSSKQEQAIFASCPLTCDRYLRTSSTPLRFR